VSTATNILHNLLDAHYSNDDDKFRAAALQAAASVRSEVERLRLQRKIEQRRESPVTLFGASAAELVVALPERDLASVFLPELVASEVAMLLRERECIPKLIEHGLVPRSRVLLHGPPGCGKTSLAAALATASRLNGFGIRLASVRKSFVGATASLLTKAFDVARNPSCLLLLDEVDAVAEIREHTAGTGAEREHTAVVATMLQLLDQPLPGVIVAATNRVDMIDPAIRRRFDLELELPAPGRQRLLDYAAALFERHRFPELPWLPELSWNTPPCVTYADVERLVLAAMRREVCR
jgi:SpoVK/Ycf46/Vps4 family AAA+-type ATPase